MNDQTAKQDAWKLRLTLVPRQIIKDIAEVRMYGVQKYPDGGPDNWKRVETAKFKLCGTESTRKSNKNLLGLQVSLLGLQVSLLGLQVSLLGLQVSANPRKRVNHAVLRVLRFQLIY